MNIREHIYIDRLRPSKAPKNDVRDEFYSDHSRIVFCSSFRRMMKKAQVFSLEVNSYVRNRLTHSLEVADIGRTLARSVGRELENSGVATAIDTECLLSIVENACLLHDIGNPPFGHFGEEAIKEWFQNDAKDYFPTQEGKLPFKDLDLLSDFHRFDGNPQGFRIATRLHTDFDEFSLNLTCSTLLATVKYPHCEPPPEDSLFSKKQGVFKSEKDRYEAICNTCGFKSGKRYFLVYLMELADDICYCLSDIADAFEKGITTSREYKAEIKKICNDQIVSDELLCPKDTIHSFSHQVAIPVSRKIIGEASKHFASNLEEYLKGDAKELSENIDSGCLLQCLKKFAKRVIYTSQEAQRLEIAGHRIVRGLLEHFGMLLRVPRADFKHFIQHGGMRKDSKLDMQWRVFNQLSKRMLKVYERQSKNKDDIDEWIERARLIVDYIGGLTDDSARDMYQNFMGISI